MAESAIEWTDVVWNPTTGCDRVSAGCDNCYALSMANRLKGMGAPKYQTDGNPATSGPGFGLAIHPDTLAAPFGWRKPRRVFVNSMSDLFHARVPREFVAQVWDVMAQTPQHTYQILTKRPDRMARVIRALPPGPWHLSPLSNVWLGTSVEDQARADQRIPALLEAPAAVRFLSMEPLLGPVDISRYLWLTGPTTAGPFRDYAGRRRPGLGGGAGGMTVTNVPAGDLHWVIVGGESGAGARPMGSQWAQGLRDQVVAAGVPFFFKQWGAWVEVGQMPEGTYVAVDAAHNLGSGGYGLQSPFRVGKKRAGRLLDERTWDEYPAVARS